MDFDLKPTFFAGEPIEDIAGIPPNNRLIISMRRNGNSVEINDTLYFDIRNSAQIARCIRGRTVNGVPDWDTSSGMLVPGWYGGRRAPRAAVVHAARHHGRAASDSSGSLRARRGVVLAAGDLPLDRHAPTRDRCRHRSGERRLHHLQQLRRRGAGSVRPTSRPTRANRFDDDFKVAYDEQLQATFQFTVEDERVAAAMRDMVVPPSPPVIGGMLSGNFDFDLKRGRAAQTFP